MTESKPVYSTDYGGRLCPECGRGIQDCICNRDGKIIGDGRVRVSRETKGRKGKGVTLISGLPLAHNDLKDLSKRFKQLCGTGGTVKNGVIEIQGDHREKLLGELLRIGYQAKISGG